MSSIKLKKFQEVSGDPEAIEQAKKAGTMQLYARYVTAVSDEFRVYELEQELEEAKREAENSVKKYDELVEKLLTYSSK